MRDKRIPIQTQAVCVDNEGNFWFTSNSFNCLFRMSSKDLKLEYVTTFEEKNHYAGSLYTKAYYYEEKIILIPCVSEHITIYDLNEKKARYVYLENEYISYNCVALNKEEILLFPSKYTKYAWIFSLESETLKKIEIVSGENEKYLISHNPLCFLGNGLIGDKAIFVIPRTNSYVKFDIRTGEINIFKLEGKTKYLNAFMCGEALFFLSVEGDSVKALGEEEKDYKLLYGQKRFIIDDKYPMAYSRVVGIEGEGDILIPVEGNDFRVLGNLDNPFGNIDWSKILGITEKSQPFVEVYKVKDKIFFFPYQCSTLVIYDCVEKDFSYCSFDIDKKNKIDIDVKIYLSDYADDTNSKELWESNEGLTLEWFLQFVNKQ